MFAMETRKTVDRGWEKPGPRFTIADVAVAAGG